MRYRYTLSLFLLLPALLSHANDNAIKSNITHVTVHLNGAEITRTASVDLNKGTQRLVFKDLSEEVDPASIQVNGTGTFTILSVKHRLDHGSELSSSAEIKALEARIKTTEQIIQDEQTQIGILQNEEQRILKNESVHGGERGSTLEQLRSINDYLRERITAVRTGINDRQRRIERLREEAQQAYLQMGQLRSRKPKARSEVLVELAVPQAIRSTFTLRYVVRSAGWSPQYDIRVHSLNSPLELVYKANVYQSSGEDWDNVQLELASGDPQQGGVMPQLAMWRLDSGHRPAMIRQENKTFDAAVRDVRGMVRDAQTGEALPFVSISATASDGSVLNTTTSNFEGYYALAIPAGGRALRISYVGYQPYRSDIHSSSMNVALQQSAVELKAFEVVQYSVPLIDRDGGASGGTLKREDIQKSPGRTASSIATTVSGTTKRGSDDGIHMRGSRPENTYYYVDGIKVYADGLDRISGGIPANYGDINTGLVNIHQPEVSVRQRNTHFAFAITLPYSIPSDGQGHSVAVKEHHVTSVYRHYCTPKLDPNAYLFAKATGWDALDLLPGPATLYFEGTYIGETYLDSEQVTDTLDISLGRDRGVQVQRVREQEFTRRHFNGNKRTESVGWNIEVRNTKGEAIELVITDQVPVPVRNEISVSLEGHDATKVDSDRGFLTWRMVVPARSTEKHGFVYSVKAPRAMPLALE
ncbi:MAG: mucoidy inhibitor MuiA family protein [Flavobacteriales bacterium]|nr:mucoidy inhibitor MuiA family protein [Flavobacteriales bacterium]